MLIGIANDSTGVSDDEARQIASAIDYQMRAHVAPAWGRLPPKVYFVRAGGAWVPGTWVLRLVDELESADALGYHTEDADGTVEGRVGVGVILKGGTVFTGAQSVSAVLSHEAIELFLDPFVGFWADAADGYSYPIEGCDAVQGDVYQAAPSVIALSNFLLPSWFDQMGKRPYDHMGKLTAPFTVAPAGYSVRRKTESGETEVYGDRPAWKAAMRTGKRAA